MLQGVRGRVFVGLFRFSAFSGSMWATLFLAILQEGQHAAG